MVRDLSCKNLLRTIARLTRTREIVSLNDPLFRPSPVTTASRIGLFISLGVDLVSKFYIVPTGFYDLRRLQLCPNCFSSNEPALFSAVLRIADALYVSKS